uniref:Uncharacterized protein n=1 Tax=Arion vulgaris TaxID=1028688 RepID=A0A0B7ARH8_9EUPU
MDSTHTWKNNHMWTVLTHGQYPHMNITHTKTWIVTIHRRRQQPHVDMDSSQTHTYIE